MDDLLDRIGADVRTGPKGRHRHENRIRNLGVESRTPLQMK
jgi:hypothetical protein